MSISWHATVTCDNWRDPKGRPCKASTTAILRLKGERNISFELPEGWKARVLGDYDSQRDVSEVDVNGGDYTVLCPKHAKEEF